MDKPLKILIVRLSALGDIVHSLPILHALKRKFPNSQISWVVEDKCADIILNNTLIHKVFVVNKMKWKSQGLCLSIIKEFTKLIQSIKDEKFDIAIDLQELFKSGIITYLSGAKRRIGHAKTREFADIFLNEKLKAHNIFDPDKMIIERYLEPAEYLGAPIDAVKFSLPFINEETKNHVNELLKDINSDKPTIIFSPATIWPTKHWIEENWSFLLDNLCLDNNIIFSGVKADIPLINRIISGAKSNKCTVIAGQTNILELIEILNRTDILVAPDTGPMHIANAVDKPIIISIFGATSYKRSAPYGDKHFALSANLPCQPCFKRKCRRKDVQMECMKKITGEMALQLIKEMAYSIRKI